MVSNLVVFYFLANQKRLAIGYGFVNLGLLFNELEGINLVLVLGESKGIKFV